MEPRIIEIPEKKLVGKCLRMTLAMDRTYELWSSFMPLRKNIVNKVGVGFYSMQVYDEGQNFDNFTPLSEFTKWAVVEVESFDNIPEGLEKYTLSGGKYAVFIHKGLPADFPETASYIFTEWLPASGFRLDNREHFEYLSENYNPTDPESEEEVWIPLIS